MREGFIANVEKERKGFYAEVHRDTEGTEKRGKSGFLAALGMTFFGAGAVERKAGQAPERACQPRRLRLQ